MEKNALDKNINTLPEIQQDIVRTCFMASKVHRNKRMYSVSLVYECLLLRIKHKSSYEHIRRRGLLPLPCINTLNNYIEKLDCGAGFCMPVFRCLGEIAGTMEINAKQGLF